MKTYLITSTYEYEIEANNKEGALEQFLENIHEDLATSNRTFEGEIIESLVAEEIKNN